MTRTCNVSKACRIPLWRDVLDTICCDKVCQSHAADLWFSPGTPVSSTNKTGRHDIIEILLKIAFSTIPPPRHPKKDVTAYVCILSFENQNLNKSVIKQVLFSSWLCFSRKKGFYMK